MLEKNPDLIQKIKGHEMAPQTLSGLFREHEIDRFRELSEECFSQPSLVHEKLMDRKGQPQGRMAHTSQVVAAELKKNLKEKLQSWLSEPYDMAFTFHLNRFPYGIHTDSGYDTTEVLYKQGIIPLDWSPRSRGVYTVIFQQKCYHSMSYPGHLQGIQALSDIERNQIEGLDSQLKLTGEELDKLFRGAEDQERFRGFELSLPFAWKLGDMALWDRAHLHCSSDFSSHGVESKLGLMWISWRTDR